MLRVLISVHLWLRWAVLFFGLLGATRLLVARGRPEIVERARRFDGTLFVAVLDLNWLVGAILLVLTRDFGPLGPRIGHGILMTVAVASAHVFRVRARREPERDFPLMLSFLVPLLVVAVGHLFLPR